MHYHTQKGGSPNDQPDEAFNRKATLLRSLSVVLCCSPVCEKQCLFALFQSYKENNVEEELIKKVFIRHRNKLSPFSLFNYNCIITALLSFLLQMLCSVSKTQSYRSVKTFITSHLYYLVAEWLAQRQSDDRYTLGSFPYSLLDHNTVKDFYKFVI